MTPDITAALEQVREWREQSAMEEKNRYERLFRNIGLKLVEALAVQWEAGHARYCGESVHNLDYTTNPPLHQFGYYGQRCYWSMPEALTEFAKEVERLR